MKFKINKYLSLCPTGARILEVKDIKTLAQ